MENYRLPLMREPTQDLIVVKRSRPLNTTGVRGKMRVGADGKYHPFVGVSPLYADDKKYMKKFKHLKQKYDGRQGKFDEYYDKECKHRRNNQRKRVEHSDRRFEHLDNRMSNRYDRLVRQFDRDLSHLNKKYSK